MATPSLAPDPRLRSAARLPGLEGTEDGRVSVVELAVLLGAGAVASLLTNLVRLRLGIPGSNIVFVAFPIGLGFALVPRRGAGLVMGAGALGTSALLALAGLRLDGVGAQTSLFLTGPMLDLALRRAAPGWRLYGAFLAACAASNAAAFLVRAMARLAGWHGAGGGGGRTLAAWWPEAIWTYALAGLVAGLISAAAWFHLRRER